MNTNMNDQAEELKKIFAEIEEHQASEAPSSDSAKVKQKASKPLNPQTIDVLNLPPRAVYHNNYRKRVQLKMRRPLLRLIFIVLCFVLIALSGYYFYGEELIMILKKL